ncbi:hypothetical protein AB0F24_35840 [Streptomyces platensis]|uniref:hypothetical protein n=1 Tax=Streptomyces platensis TaxID=58346 RepID=UPI0033E43319
MDQGLVALATAGVGLVGAIGGAAIGGIAAARGARVGAETAARATARQVRDQAAADHAHWLRERRLEACRDFLGAYDEYAGAATAFAKLLQGNLDGSGTPEPVTLHPSILALNRTYFLIRIVGSEEVRQAAKQVQHTQVEHAETLYAWRRAYLSQDDRDVADAVERHGTRLDQLSRAYGEFVAATNRAVATPVEPGEASDAPN